ncbi:LamG-like jellyroll fold domain-containing protein [Streptomyces sp. NPDC002463]|uniref:LamG-like jellyroll fold domain-containing protein n=1 Tax=Streptomyces sp. NPDC002463 TaxID=3364645 RepID=UPI0036A2E3D9
MAGIAPAAAVVSTDVEQTGTDGSQPAADTPESIALREAKDRGQPVDVPSMRDEFSEVTARPDGMLESVTHVQPVRTRKDGHWVGVDTTLQAAPDGMVEPKAVLPGLAFSGGGDDPLVRMTRAGKVFELSWPKPLPEPQLQGDSALYSSVLPGVDLKMTATRTGYNQILVVKTREAAANPELQTLRLGLNTDGLSLRENADGSIEASDTAAGGTVFAAPKPMMYDSSQAAKEGPGNELAQVGNPQPATMSLTADIESENEAHAATVGVEVTTDGQSAGEEQALLLTPSQALLNDPDTVYPVHIDPAMDTPHASAWAGISQAYPSQPYYKFTYNSTYVPDFGTGYCASPRCSTADVKRVLYRIPVTSKFDGKHILSAEFSVWESHSYNCTARPVQLYLTGGIGSGTTWNNSSSDTFWDTRLQTVNAAKGWSGTCPAGNLEFGGTTGAVKDAVQRIVNGTGTSITFGLRAENESASGADAWKRFTDDASLSVRYNLPPHQAAMSKLTMSPGSICSSSVLKINRMPQITATLTDPDLEKVGAQFAAAWDAGDGTGFKRRWWSTGAEGTAPAASSFKNSGSPFSVTLPTSVPKNKTVGWEVRGWDGAEWGLWSSAGNTQTDCYFHVDTTFPAGPSVTSDDYPGSHDMQDSLPWTDGVGKYGTFVIDSTSTDVVKYQYGFDTDASANNEIATTGGGARTVTLLMQTAGPHMISVKAIDNAGNATQSEPYYFNVWGGHPQRAGWSMDDAANAGALASVGGTFDATFDSSALIGADASLNDATPGVEGYSGNAVALYGKPAGHFDTDRAVLETNRSFTMSAWVKPKSINPVASAALAQLGQRHSITLGAIGAKWAIKAPSTDSSASDSTWYNSTSSATVVVDKWTHLAGVYNASAKTLTIYVDGVPGTPATNVTMWSARGKMMFGGMQYAGKLCDPWDGSIDDIAVWDRALSSSELSEAAQGRPVTTGLPAKAVWDLNDSGSTMTGRSETADATLYGGVATAVSGIAGKAARFDGVDDYARTTRPQVDGTRSFAVSTWVRIPTPAAGDIRPRMIATQNGVNQNEFSLYYSAADKKWKFGRYTEDAASATLITTQQPVCTGPVAGAPCFGQPNNEWTHLLGVSDAKTGKLRLFVNGYQVSETAYTQVKPWASPGGLQLGAVNRAGTNAEFLGGDIDDVRVYDRVVTADEAKLLVKQRPQVGGRWKFNEASGTPLTSPDESVPAEPAVLYSGAQINSGGGYLATGSLILDGTDDYAATTRMPVYTGQSFSVTAWAATASISPTRDMTVLSIAGAKQSAIEVGWDYISTVAGEPVGQWKVSVTSEDGTESTRTSAEHTYDGSIRMGTWNHLAVVYDGFADQLSLYVNGSLENQLCPDDAPSGTCTDHVSWATAVQPFVASNQVQFGRNIANGAWGSYFSGEIDDVWIYQGILSPAQVITLADPNIELDTATGP